MAATAPKRDLPPHPGEVWLEIIEGAKVTQTWLAMRMGISTKHLNLIVKGKQRPSPMHTVVFAEVMGVSLEKVWAVQCAWELARAKAEAEARPNRSVEPPAKWRD